MWILLYLFISVDSVWWIGKTSELTAVALYLLNKLIRQCKWQTLPWANRFYWVWNTSLSNNNAVSTLVIFACRRFQHYSALHDVQTLAMLSCVFADKPATLSQSKSAVGTSTSSLSTTTSGTVNECSQSNVSCYVTCLTEFCCLAFESHTVSCRHCNIGGSLRLFSNLLRRWQVWSQWALHIVAVYR